MLGDQVSSSLNKPGILLVHCCIHRYRDGLFPGSVQLLGPERIGRRKPYRYRDWKHPFHSCLSRTNIGPANVCFCSGRSKNLRAQQASVNARLQQTSLCRCLANVASRGPAAQRHGERPCRSRVYARRSSVPDRRPSRGAGEGGDCAECLAVSRPTPIDIPVAVMGLDGRGSGDAGTDGPGARGAGGLAGGAPGALGCNLEGGADSEGGKARSARRCGLLRHQFGWTSRTRLLVSRRKSEPSAAMV